MRSFWLNQNLIGAYIISGTYIRDMVVDPDYQNRGYGSIILDHCINHLLKFLVLLNIRMFQNRIIIKLGG
ncbi:GNAT family N-acetyltransferase [Paenibacillus sp. MER TA 81-3]|uniref:GNAT family N-acetyltransferase n=1 Tax=Paenibacillus sp. MER TA 81-3 TaxID=2939573 RepID=UPI0034D96FA0